MVKLAGAAYLVFLGVRALIQSRRVRAEAVGTLPDAPVGIPWRTLLVLIHAALTAVWLGGYAMLPAKARALSQ